MRAGVTLYERLINYLLHGLRRDRRAPAVKVHLPALSARPQLSLWQGRRPALSLPAEPALPGYLPGESLRKNRADMKGLRSLPAWPLERMEFRRRSGADSEDVLLRLREYRGLR